MWAGKKPSYTMGVDEGGLDETVIAIINRYPYGTVAISDQKLFETTPFRFKHERLMWLPSWPLRKLLPVRRIIELMVATGAVSK